MSYAQLNCTMCYVELDYTNRTESKYDIIAYQFHKDNKDQHTFYCQNCKPDLSAVNCYQCHRRQIDHKYNFVVTFQNFNLQTITLLCSAECFSRQKTMANEYFLEVDNDTLKTGCPNCFSKIATKTCSRCKNIKYCSKECQVAHWSTHKTHCIESNKQKND